MTRRKTVNKTGLNRIDGIPVHHAWVGFICLKCSVLNKVDIGLDLIDPKVAYETQSWKCGGCGYVHTKSSDLPFKNWSKAFRSSKSDRAQRFWIGFFRICTEHPSSYWKQCNACGRSKNFEPQRGACARGAQYSEFSIQDSELEPGADRRPRRGRPAFHPENPVHPVKNTGAERPRPQRGRLQRGCRAWRREHSESSIQDSEGFRSAF